MLRSDPFGHVQIGKRLPGAHLVQRSAHIQPLDIAGRTRLDHRLVALVPSDVAGHRQLRIQGALHYFCGAHTQVLLHARAHRHAAAVGALRARIHRHQHHVHEGRFGRRIEAFARHHRVVVVQHALAGARIHVAGLEAIFDMTAGGFLARGDAAQVGGCGCRRGVRIAILVGAALHAHPVERITSAS